MESEIDWACSVDLYEKVAQPAAIKSTIVQEKRIAWLAATTEHI